MHSISRLSRCVPTSHIASRRSKPCTLSSKAKSSTSSNLARSLQKQAHVAFHKQLIAQSLAPSSSKRCYSTSDTTTNGHALPSEVKDMLRKLMANKRDVGDFSPQSMLATVIRVFKALKQNGDAAGSKAFFLNIFEQLGPQLDSIKTNAAAFVRAVDDGRDEGVLLASHASLRDSLSGTLEKLFDLILAQPGGMHVLVEMRQVLLKVIADVTKAQKEASKSKTSTTTGADSTDANTIKVELGRLKAVEQALRSKLQHLFSIGYLELERMTWSSPASLLEKIKAYSDSVHPMDGWDGMKKRLGANRRCFGLFHPSMPLEPLVFIEVALTKEISSKIRPILDATDANEPLDEPFCAIFYAITSTQPGLSGVDLGHMLIEQVVVALQKEFPSITTFSTFSPIPGFKVWFDSKLSMADKADSGKIQLTEDESAAISAAYSEIFGEKSNESGVHLLAKLIDSKEWFSDDRVVKVVEKPLNKIIARYLAVEKKRGLALDPVANFHVRNGAQLHRLCFLADTSPKRLKQSYGFMVNYLYQIDRLVENNEKYLTDGVIPLSDQIQQTLRM